PDFLGARSGDDGRLRSRDDRAAGAARRTEGDGGGNGLEAVAVGIAVGVGDDAGQQIGGIGVVTVMAGQRDRIAGDEAAGGAAALHYLAEGFTALQPGGGAALTVAL